MKKLIVTILGFLFLTVHAQRHELGLFLGGANVIGDIGRTNYINPFPQQMADGSVEIPIAVGAMYRFNFNPQMGLRANLTYANVAGSDFNAVEFERVQRGFEYQNNIIEASLLFEYNFFDFNTIQQSAHTPFIFAGVGTFGYKTRDYTITHALLQDADGNDIPPTSSTQFSSTLSTEENYDFNVAIPFGIGYKFKYKWNWVISFELGARWTNTDNIDYSIPSTDDFTINVADATLNSNAPLDLAGEVENRNNAFIRGRQTGDIADNDWYVFTGVGVTYTFGRPPCYCD